MMRTVAAIAAIGVAGALALGVSFGPDMLSRYLPSGSTKEMNIPSYERPQSYAPDIDTSRKETPVVPPLKTPAVPDGNELQIHSVRVEPYANPKLTFEVPGTVLDIPVKAGQPVKKGTVLMRIDPVRAKAQHATKIARVSSVKTTISGAEAGVGAAEAKVSMWNGKVQRLRSLRGSGAASAEEYETAYGGLQVAQFELAAAKTKVAEAKAELLVAEAEARETEVLVAKHELLAPSDGQVMVVNVNVGDSLKDADGKTAIQFVCLDKVRLTMEVVDNLANREKLKVGSEISVTIPGTTTALKAKVVTIEDEIRPSSSGPMCQVVRAEVENKRGVNDRWLLVPGMTVAAAFPKAEPLSPNPGTALVKAEVKSDRSVKTEVAVAPQPRAKDKTETVVNPSRVLPDVVPEVPVVAEKSTPKVEKTTEVVKTDPKTSPVKFVSSTRVVPTSGKKALPEQVKDAHDAVAVALKGEDAAKAKLLAAQGKEAYAKGGNELIVYAWSSGVTWSLDDWCTSYGKDTRTTKERRDQAQVKPEKLKTAKTPDPSAIEEAEKGYVTAELAYQRSRGLLAAAEDLRDKMTRYRSVSDNRADYKAALSKATGDVTEASKAVPTAVAATKSARTSLQALEGQLATATRSPVVTTTVQTERPNGSLKDARVTVTFNGVEGTYGGTISTDAGSGDARTLTINVETGSTSIPFDAGVASVALAG